MSAETTTSRPVFGLTEKREFDRIQLLAPARVIGTHGTFDALLVNISRTGVLLTIVDPDWDHTPSSDDFGMAGLRVASHFGEGIRIEVDHVGVTMHAEVVRITEKRVDGKVMQFLGCHFHRELTEEQRGALGLASEDAAVAHDALERVAGLAHAAEALAVGVGGIPGETKEPYSPGQACIFAAKPPVEILELLREAVRRRATDIHLKGDSPVRLRVDGELEVYGDRTLTPDEVHGLICDLLSPEQYARFCATNELDTAYSLAGHARFRINVLRARGVMGMAIRRIPEEVPHLSQLRLSPACTEVAEIPRGLVLVTGPTGSGKSTTLAAMIQHVNMKRRCHIVTMEDPIEYIHTERLAHITQREIGRDTEDFASALKRALRQDPDVLLVGEMRDLETIALAVTAAETGHLVFATLHTTSAVLTVDRIVDAFPPTQQRQVRMQLADCLRGIFSQVLLPKLGGGVVVAQEVLIATAGVRALIREGKAPQITNMMQTGSRVGMQTLEDSLNELVRNGEVKYEVAIGKANHPELIRPK